MQSPAQRIASRYLVASQPSILAKLRFGSDIELYITLEIPLPNPGEEDREVMRALEEARKAASKYLIIAWRGVKVTADSVSVTGMTRARRKPKGKETLEPKLPSAGYVESKIEAIPGVYQVHWM